MTSITQEDRLSFLTSWTCKGLTPSSFKLQSYLNSYVLNIADKLDLKLNNGFKNKFKTCPYCFHPWSVDTTTFKLLPPKKSKKKKKTDNEEKHSQNTLVLKCKICLKTSIFRLLKRKVKVKDVPQEVVEVKKKRKKKDKTCGLRINPIKPDKGKDSKQKKKKKKKRCIESDSTPSKPTVPKPKPISNQSQKPTTPNFVPQVKNQKQNEIKLQKLQKALKGDKGFARKTFADFLNLI